MGTINDEDPSKFPFYDQESKTLEIPLVIRSIHSNESDYKTATQAVVSACEKNGFALSGNVPSFSAPSLYLTHDNPLTALQYASYKATIRFAPDEFSGPNELLDISYPVGTTGGTLALSLIHI